MGSYFSISVSAVENSTNIIDNTSNVTVSLWCNGSNGYAEDNPSYWLQIWAPDGTRIENLTGTRNFSYENFTVTTWTGKVDHNSDGTGSITYQGYFQGTDKPNGDTTPVYTLNLTTLPRTSEILDGTTSRAIDEGISFSIDKKVQDFSDKLTIYPVSDSSLTTVVSPYTTGSTVQIGTSTLDSIKALAPTTTYTSMVVKVETFASGTSIGSTSSVFRGSFTAAPPSITPTWSASPTYENVTGHDNVTISLGTSATPDEGTTISAYEFTIGSTTLTTTTYSIYFPDVENNDVSVKIIDRRGLSTTVSTSNLFGIVEYSNPTMIGSINRYPDLVATGAQLNFSGTYTFVNEDITDAGTEVSYKINNGNWTTLYGWTIDYSGNYSGTITFPSGTFDAAQNHVVYVRFNDSYEVIEKRFNLSKAAVTLDMDLTNQRVGIGQPIPESLHSLGQGGLVVDGEINTNKGYYIKAVNLLDILHPIGSILTTTNSVNPSTYLGGNWMPLYDTFLYGSKSAYRIGGVSEVRITEEQMASHIHKNYRGTYDYEGWGNGTLYYGDYGYIMNYYGNVGNPGTGNISSHTATTPNGATQNTGNNQPHANMPPFMSVYMWERIADFPNNVSYDFVEGIKGTGTQYIDFGFIPTSNTGISLKNIIEEPTTKAFFGAMNTDGSGLILAYEEVTIDDPKWSDPNKTLTLPSLRLRPFRLGPSSNDYVYYPNFLTDIPHVYQYNFLNDGNLLLDGLTIGQDTDINKGTSTISKNLTLLGLNRQSDDTVSIYDKNMTITDCILTEGTQLTHRLKPAVRTSDSKPGLYDLITQNFYTNSGTGEFITV